MKIAMLQDKLCHFCNLSLRRCTMQFTTNWTKRLINTQLKMLKKILRLIFSKGVNKNFLGCGLLMVQAGRFGLQITY